MGERVAPAGILGRGSSPPDGAAVGSIAVRAVAWCSALILAMLVAWLLVSRARTGSAGISAARAGDRSPAESPGARLSPAAVDAAHAPRQGLAESSLAHESNPEVSAHTLLVRSSIGLPLPFVEWEARENDWRRQDLDHSRCEIGRMKLPCRIRAPGHTASLATKAGEEILLEPDALIVVEASGLRSCLGTIRPYDDYITDHEDEASMRPELRRTIAWGWISDDRWALAATSELMEEAVGRGQPLYVMLRWRDGQIAEIEFAPKAGARGSWTAPCGPVIDAAPLDVHVVRPAGTESGRIALRIRPAARQDSVGRVEEYRWGKVNLHSREHFWQDETIPSESQDAHIAGVPEGQSLSLIVRDEKSSAYGRLLFDHDGSPRTLVLRSAFEATGRLVSGTTATPVTTSDVWWQFKEGEENVWGWQAQAQSLALGPDGGFTLRGPGAPLTSEDASLDPPAHLLIHIAAPGYKPFERLYDTGGVSRFDCGEIRLTPVAGEIVLAPTEGLSTKSVRWQGVMISSAPGIWWTIQDAAPAPDGRLTIFFARSEEHPDLLRVWEKSNTRERAWPSDPPERILIHVLLDDGDTAWGFERRSDGCYVAVPRGDHEIDAECRSLPSEGQGWQIGIQWHGIWDSVKSVSAQRLGQHVHLHITTPREGAILYWSPHGRPPGTEQEGGDSGWLAEDRSHGSRKTLAPGGSIPIDALTGTLVLQ